MRYMPDTFIEGIDVSSNQGEVDWGAVARVGKAFGFARATIGGHQADPQFVANWQRVSDAGELYRNVIVLDCNNRAEAESALSR